jgi:carboxylesterase type B
MFLIMSKLVQDINALTVVKAKQLISTILSSGFKVKSDFAQKIADFYISKELKDGDKVKLAQAIAASLGDFLLTCPTINFGWWAAKWNKNNKVYAYMLAKQPTYSFWKKSNPNWEGVCHAEELLYLFGVTKRESWPEKKSWPLDDKQMSSEFIKSWASFATTG